MPPKYVKYPAGTEMAAKTLKGKAVTAAIEAGLIPKTDRGYPLGCFLRFWEKFSPAIDQSFEDYYEVRKMREESTEGDHE